MSLVCPSRSSSSTFVLPSLNTLCHFSMLCTNKTFAAPYTAHSHLWMSRGVQFSFVRNLIALRTSLLDGGGFAASIVERSQLDKYTLVPLTNFYTDYCIPTEHSYFYFLSPGLPSRAQKNAWHYLLNISHIMMNMPLCLFQFSKINTLYRVIHLKRHPLLKNRDEAEQK